MMKSKSSMPPGSPIDLTGTRRAFPLDSRTVWVEQQIVMNGIVSKDNLFVSPLDYDPKPVERHVPATTIARPKTVDTFHPYRGNSGGTNNTISKRGSGILKKSSKKEPLGDMRGTLGTRTEFVSPFADHDKRMPLDPSRRYYITDTPALPADPFLATRCHSDGPRSVDQLGSYMCQDQTARTRIVKANPQSDSVYDTDRDMFRKRTVGGKFNIQTQTHKERKDQSASCKNSTKKEDEAAASSPGPKPFNKNGSMKVLVSAGPPIRTRTQPVVKYDASCYQLNKKQGGINMTPKESRNRAKVNVFQGMITTQLGYQSKNIESPLAERIRRNYM